MEPKLPHLGLGIVAKKESYSLTVPADAATVAVVLVRASVYARDGSGGGEKLHIARGGDVSFEKVRVRFHRTA